MPKVRWNLHLALREYNDSRLGGIMQEKDTSLKLLHGGDYNPEQWLDRPDILEKDIQYFKLAKINTVSVGIFSWASLEPTEGDFQLDWLAQIIDNLYSNGISVILATPSGSRPKWMADKYPEVLRVNEERHRNLYGARHNHCYTSPVYRDKVRTINMRLAQRFDNHQGVLMWHLSNEYGGECHCPLCQLEFRKWLENRYDSIEELNDRWCTTFWSHRYNSFEQIEGPSSRGESGMHALNLEWKRFVTARTSDFVQAEVKALRDAGAKKLVTANLMYDFKELDYNQFAKEIDVVSYDNYPTWHKEPESVTAMDSGLQFDLMRSLKKQPFLLMESCPSATSWQPVSKLKHPGLLKAASLQSIAHGSDSVMYFQMRQSRGSCEKFHGAVIDHYGGSDTRVFKEVCEVGDALVDLSEVQGSYCYAEAAVIYDRNNYWALEDASGPRNSDMHYKECIDKSYRALRQQGINVDIIGLEHDFADYRLIAAPMQYLFDDDFADKVRAFVEAGGVFLMTYWSGIVDKFDRCFAGGTPHGLMDVMGLRSMEIDGLYDWEHNHAVPVKNSSWELGARYECRYLCDLVQTTSAKTLLEYADNFYQGMPAFTQNQYGQGLAYYVCADMEQGFYDEIYPRLIADAGISPVIKNIPREVEVTVRESAVAKYIFIQNFGKDKVKIAEQIEAYEVFYGPVNMELERYETIVLKQEK